MKGLIFTALLSSLVLTSEQTNLTSSDSTTTVSTTASSTVASTVTTTESSKENSSGPASLTVTESPATSPDLTSSDSTTTVSTTASSTEASTVTTTESSKENSSDLTSSDSTTTVSTTASSTVASTVTTTESSKENSSGPPSLTVTESPATSPASPSPSTSPSSSNHADSKATDSTVTSPDSTSNTTAPASGPTSNTTDSASDSTSNTTASAPGSTTTTASTPDSSCKSKPCGTNGATCVDLQGGHFCRCPYSYYYTNTSASCNQGKQFFGSIGLTEPYLPEMQQPNSPAYAKLYKKVTDFCQDSLKNLSGYSQTVIIKIRPGPQTKGFQKAARATGTETEVSNLFTENSTATAGAVTSAIETAVQANNDFTSFKNVSDCNATCDMATTTCESSPTTIPVCICKEGFYAPINTFVTYCSDCEPSCTKQYSKECVRVPVDQGIVPHCQCITGYKLDNGKCQECSFGLSGKECSDNFLLILVIVGSVAGALIIGLLGGVIGLAVKKNSNYPDKERLIKHEENPVFGSAMSVENTYIPRVKVKPALNMTKATPNPYSTTEDPYKRTQPARDYDDDNDSWYEMSAKDGRNGNHLRF